MSQEVALALAALVAPFVVQLFRYVLNRFSVSLKGIPALAVAAVVALVLAFLASLLSGELDFSPDGIAVVFALAHVVYIALRDKLGEWMPAE